MSSSNQTQFEDSASQEPEIAPESSPVTIKWFWVLLALIISLLGSGAVVWRLFNKKASHNAVTTTASQTVKVKLATVESATVEDTSEYIASLQSRRSVNLQPKIPGKVTQVFLRPGTQVASGKAIMQIEGRDQQATNSQNQAFQAAKSQLENAKATLASLEAERLSKQQDVIQIQQEFQRLDNLAAVGAVSRQTRERYKNHLANTQGILANMKARTRTQQVAVSQAEKAFQQLETNQKQQQTKGDNIIYAPFTGTISDLLVKAGDSVSTSTQLAIIKENQPLEVNISVPIERAMELRQGMPVEIMNAQGKLIGVSRVISISPIISNNTQSVLIKSLFDNTSNQVLPDQFAKARIIWNRRLGVWVPTTAVLQTAGESFVFVAREELTPKRKPQLVAKQKRVKLGNLRGNSYPVLEGLNPGEKIVTNNILQLRDGALIAK